MIKTDNITNIVESGLNNIDQDVKFKLVTELGIVDDYVYFYGIVSCKKDIPETITEIVDVDYSYSCQILIPTTFDSTTIQEVRTIIDKFVELNNGHEYDIAEGKGLFTFANVVVDKKPKEYSNYVVINFDINVKYTEGVVTARSKHWFLDDYEIKYSTEGVYIDKDGETKKINDENYSKTLLTGQKKTYKFTLPYSKNSEICKILQQDILNGDLNKTYKLKYHDGFAFTEFEPFETTVSIFPSANTSAQVTKSSQFNITFADVDDGQGSVKYYLGLCDTNFDLNSENTRYFEASNGKRAQQVQIEYWEDKVLNGCEYEQIKAPNMNSIDITNQIYCNSRKYDLYDLVNKNYAVIKVEKDGKPIKYFYYFVTNGSIGAQNQVAFDLKLDTIQTYFFDAYIKFGDCLIKKAHLNRFLQSKDNDNLVSFDNTINSPLFEREDIKGTAKRLIKRQKLSLNNYFNSPTANEWLDDNVLAWVYAFVSPKHEFYYPGVGDPKSFQGFGTMIAPNGTQEMGYGQYPIDSKLKVLCVPLMKGGNHLHIGNDFGSNGEKDVILEFENGLQKFFNDNSEGEYIYSMRLSAMPPFSKPRNGKEQFYFTFPTNSEDMIIYDALRTSSLPNIDVGNGSGKVAFTTSSGKNYGFFSVDLQRDSIITSTAILKPRLLFTKTEIVGVKKDIKFNPKLLNSDYYEVKISDQTGEGFSYDLQKLGLKEVSFKYSEPLTPDLTKCYIRLNLPENYEGLYDKGTMENYTGFVSTNDMSLVLETSAYRTMLANQKNYFAQKNLSYLEQGLKSTFSGVQNGGAGLLQSLGGTGLNIGFDMLNTNLTLDNLKAAPSKIENAKGNAAFNYMVSGVGVFCEEYCILPSEQKLINDYTDLYGFNFNQIDNIKKYVNVRKYHNYIQAELNSIVGVPMSNNARADIKQRFQNGIRFWNSDHIQYEFENYEKWLES